MAGQIIGRRQLLKTLLVAGGAIGAASFVPEKWIRPFVHAGVLPVHAQGSTIYENEIIIPYETEGEDKMGPRGGSFEVFVVPLGGDNTQGINNVVITMTASITLDADTGFELPYRVTTSSHYGYYYAEFVLAYDWIGTPKVFDWIWNSDGCAPYRYTIMLS